MPRQSKKQQTSAKLKLPDISSGNWKGELVGGATISFGQVVQKTSPPNSVEFSQIIASVSLVMPDGSFTWPGVLFIMAPTPMKPESADSGMLLKSSELPALCLSLDVTRAQFTDLLRSIEYKRFRRFRFAVGEARDGSWPVTSWGTEFELLAS